MKSPIEQKAETKQREINKRAERQEVLKIAEGLCKNNLEVALEIVRRNLGFKEKSFDIFKNMNTEDILKGGITRYLCRRAAFEAEIKVLKNISNLPMVYEKESNRILNPSPTSGRKKQKQGG